MRASQAWIEDPGLVGFFGSHRNRPEDLYPSEQRFLPWLATQADSVLDVGCAAGGFAPIWRHYRPQLHYLGVDLAPLLVQRARELHPDLAFLVADCADGLPLEAEHADVVAALGWLHWEPRYAEAIAELWRVTRRWLFFDVRLVDSEADLTGGTQRLAYEGSVDHRTPYVCVSWSRFAQRLLDLQPDALFGYGYWGPPADSVEGVDRRVCFATFVLERAPQSAIGDGELVAALELPMPWPGARNSTTGAVPRLVPLIDRVPAPSA